MLAMTSALSTFWRWTDWTSTTGVSPVTVIVSCRAPTASSIGTVSVAVPASSMPSRRMAQGLERLGFPPQIIGYYTKHVEADAVHEQVALREVGMALVREEPALEPDVWFGAWACLDLESRTARRMLRDWGLAT